MTTATATTRDVAKALGVSPQRVRQYAAEARIPFRRTPGGHRRYDMGAMRAALARLERLHEGPARSRLLDAAAAAIRKVEPGAQVMLFGSRARGDAQPESDWDLAVIVDGPLQWRRRQAIWDSVFELELEDPSFPIFGVLVFDRAGWERRLAYPGVAQNIVREGIDL